MAGYASADLQLDSTTQTATAGYFQLHWRGNSGPVELQQAGDKAFTHPHTLYRGRDDASVISGLPNGEYYYRIRELNGHGWTQPIHVTVTHHPVTRAFAFFALGALMFVALLAVIRRGYRE